MEKLKALLACSVFLVLSSCETSLDCSFVTCLALNYEITLTDANTGENIIATTQLSDSDILVTNSNNEQVEAFVFQGAIVISPRERRSNCHKLMFRNTTIEYAFDFTEGGSNCCDFGVLQNVDVRDNDFIVNGNSIEILLN